MGRLALLAALLCMQGVFAADVRAGEEPPPLGRLVFDQPWHDFGRVADKQLLHHTFRFRVEGAPLRIDKVITACGCTTAELKQRDYAPGERGQIEATVDTTDFNGLIYKEIFLELSGAAESRVELGLTAVVEPGVKAND